MYFGKTGMNVRFLFLQTAIFFLQQHRFSPHFVNDVCFVADTCAKTRIRTIISSKCFAFLAMLFQVVNFHFIIDAVTSIAMQGLFVT